jgi:S1-C subfamily serine protease
MNNPTDKQTTVRKPNWRQPALYVLLPAIGVGTALLGDHARIFGTGSVSPGAVVAQTPSRGGALLSATDPNFVVNVVDRTGPSVVRIDSSRTVKSRIPAALNDSLRDLPGGGMPRERVRRGTGSGFIIKSDGVILTNAHVVEGADSVTVTLTDGRELQGRVMGADSLTDVAVIKVEANNLPAVALGNSDQLRPGEWAIAIGNPLGLNNTVTVGIVSGTGRTSSQVGAPDKRVGFIQTDAAINPGNSGGPLLNQRGEVIGMNTAIRADGQGLGFAIPINTAQQIANQLITKGKVDHPYLGIRMGTLTPELKRRINQSQEANLNVQDDRGVLIFEVMRNSPAAKAGLKPGDVLLKINNQPVLKSEEVQQEVDKSSVGGTMQVQLKRNGQTLTLSVSPGAFPTRTAQSE